MKLNLTILLFLQCFVVFGQGEIDDQEKIFYRNERTFAFLLNSNGLGFNFRYAKRIDAFRKTLYESEFNYLKHPKEQKATIEATNRNIIYGKLNSVYTLKGSIGYQKELFQKRDLGGISIRMFYNFGPSIAFMKPVYYEYFDITKQEYFYDKFQQHGNFVGRGPFTKGFGEISLSPGFYTKLGFTFEYSRLDKVFHGLEAGVAIDGYIRKLKIMDVPSEKIFFVLPDNHFVLTLFVSYRFGKVVDAKFNPKRSAIDDMLLN